MTAIEKEVLQNGLCGGCDCKNFQAKLNYEVDTTTKKAKVTDASTFDTGDGFEKVLVHVYDANGKQAHGHIDAAAGNVEIDITTFDLSDITITATVISQKGCKADLGIYNIGSTALTGAIGNKANQGNRNLN